MRDYTLLSIFALLSASVWQIGLSFVLLQSGLAAAFARLVEKDSQMQFVRAATYCLFVMAFLFFLSLPIKVLVEFGPEKAFGLTNDTSFSYIVSKFIDFIAGCIHSIPMIALAMVLAKRFPKHWGFYTGALFAAGYAVQMLIMPYFLEDNSGYLKPLNKPEVQMRVDAIFKKAGLDGAKVLVENVPATKKLNAYATGAGPSSRFVLYESVVNRLSADEIEAMIAHEISHIKLNHLSLNLLMICAFLILAPIAAQLVAPYVIPRLPPSWGISKVDDLPTIALAFFIVLSGNFLFMPVQNYFSRQFELQADQQALALTGNPEAFARQLSTFARFNLDDMDPPAWAVATLYSHPSVKERILAALKNGIPQPVPSGNSVIRAPEK
jgi:STE24 endopeptidase